MQQRRKHRVRIQLALRRGANDTRQDLLAVGAMPGLIPTTDFTRDNGRPERLLRPPVRGVDRRVEKTPDCGKLARQVSTQSLDVWDGTGPRARPRKI